MPRRPAKGAAAAVGKKAEQPLPEPMDENEVAVDTMQESAGTTNGTAAAAPVKGGSKKAKAGVPNGNSVEEKPAAGKRGRPKATKAEDEDEEPSEAKAAKPTKGKKVVAEEVTEPKVVEKKSARGKKAATAVVEADEGEGTAEPKAAKAGKGRGKKVVNLEEESEEDAPVEPTKVVKKADNTDGKKKVEKKAVKKTAPVSDEPRPAKRAASAVAITKMQENLDQKKEKAAGGGRGKKAKAAA